MRTDDAFITDTQTWLTRAVIGLQLCPFAKAVHLKNQIRYVVSHATEPQALLETLHALEDTMGTESAADAVSRSQILQRIDAEVAELPARQREAFLLRYWEEFDVAETAAVMGCSEGSVKTHCSRAVHALAKALRSKGITL